MVLFFMSNAQAQFLKACCGRDQMKYILTGIHFEVEPEGEVIAVSCDGKRCAVVEIEKKISKKFREVLHDLIILPPPKLDKKSRVGLCYDPVSKKFQWNIQNKDDAMYEAKSIQGKFPNWRLFLKKTEGNPNFRYRFDSDLVPSGFKYELEFADPLSPIISNCINKDEEVQGLKFFFMPMKPFYEGTKHGISVEGIVRSIEKLDEKDLDKVRKALEKAREIVA